MTINKRSKNVRQRGHSTHGWGSKKKHRGKGHQGGAGMAGSGKRADSKKPSVWADANYFGKHGFISKSRTPDINSVNIGYIEIHINKYLEAKSIKNENGFYVVDLKSLGYNKLLASGRVSMKFKINTPYASKSAIEKVSKAGGEVTIAK
ncbi:MAG: uL15 family ribosomal protein [Nanoarchaeota archaeon]